MYTFGDPNVLPFHISVPFALGIYLLVVCKNCPQFLPHILTQFLRGYRVQSPGVSKIYHFLYSRTKLSHYHAYIDFKNLFKRSKYLLGRMLVFSLFLTSPYLLKVNISKKNLYLFVFFKINQLIMGEVFCCLSYRETRPGSPVGSRPTRCSSTTDADPQLLRNCVNLTSLDTPLLLLIHTS